MSTHDMTGRTAPILARLATETPGEQEVEFVRVLNSRIIGQEAGKAAASRAIRRANNKLRNKRGPIYRLLQIGKSRTGKTLTAETAALSLHGDPDALVRVDCAEYQHGHEVSRLLGAPPSYVGYDDPNKGGDDKGGGDDKPGEQKQTNPTALLARKNLIASRKGSKTPITIVLLDEVEKCSSSLKDVLLAIFDRGKIRLANNTEADFTDCIFFMTSNLGMEKVEKIGNSIGFTNTVSKPATVEEIESVVKIELKRAFRPEFMKRVDEVVIFANLTDEQLYQLYDMEIGLVKERITKQLDAHEVFELRVEDSVRPFIMGHAMADEGGVAEVKHVLERYLVDTLGNELGKGTISGGDLVVVSHTSGDAELTFMVGKGQGKAVARKTVVTTKPGSPLLLTSAAKAMGKEDGHARLMILAERKLRASAKDKSFYQPQISIGHELGTLAKEMGKEWTDFHTLQYAFMTPEAYKLLWPYVYNEHHYWMILGEAASQAEALPIRVENVRGAVAKLRAKTNVTPEILKFGMEDPVEAAQLVLEGVLLIKIDEKTGERTLQKNPLYS